MTFANNDGWHDDMADGPVTAQVTLGGQALSVEPAWVVVAPPNYGPCRKSVRTHVGPDARPGRARAAGWQPARPSFTADILPDLRAPADLQWVNAGFAAAFGWDGPIDFAVARHASPASPIRPPANADFRQTSSPAASDDPDRDAWSRGAMAVAVWRRR